ncbi:MAG: Polysaccharide export outer membrane protein [Bacteroidetes bacterium 38_7]|nr:MAG: Polysaccharide export outer membrane protein [Bacteroidetes bacterium 38_7]HCC85635.1 sugar transporter [Porphyromonadaceae bacterium]
MKKNIILYGLVLLIMAAVPGCGSSKKIAYLQGIETMTPEELAQATSLYDARIMPKDLLTIVVSTTDPEASRPFNLVMPTVSQGISTSSGYQGQLQTYLVDNNGQIEFPVVGMITVKGLTKRQAEEKVKGLLRTYLKEEPVVTVRFVNYKISVVGEVARPNTFTIQNEKVNVFEALAMAGDMTIWGRRDNVKILREDADGNKRVTMMNLNDPYVIFHPDFYLQQNDVVYVEPNKVKAQNAEIGSATGIWLSATSILISVATLLVNVLK